MEVDGSETFDWFDMELHLLSINMRQKFVKAIKLFLNFLKAFDFPQVHNMLALMLDLHFKSLWVVECNPTCS
jgi:hypothetical protein